MLNIIDGKKLSEQLILESKSKIEKFSKYFRNPTLVVITVGCDDASKIYVNKKRLACEMCNINFIHKPFPLNISREVLSEEIRNLNLDDTVDGIFVQLPIPEDLYGIEQEIAIDKDLDGFNIYNLGNTLYNTNKNLKLYSCTPLGIINMFKYYNINLEGKHVVIIGRSIFVGKPLIGMLLEQNATVTSCNSYTKNLKNIAKSADILISAVGKPNFIDSSFISQNIEAIIDVGISRDKNGKLCGDINFNEVSSFLQLIPGIHYITPVPGGVGPMTVASLINNVVISYEKHIKS